MSRGFAVAANVKAEVIAAAAREAEATGYTSFWVNHPGPFDGLASVAVAAKATQRIALGIGVIPLHTRGPASIVEGARTHALPLDRLWLGVGSPNPRSLERVRDGVAAVRKELRTKLVVAALGPKMCRLAGEIADGVLFNWLTPEHAKASAALVREGAQAAKRPAPRMFGYVRLAMGPGAADRVAELPAWQPALADLRRRVPGFFAGRRVFEVACGTGYWTAYVATPALGVHATDVNDETLALA